MFDRMIFKGHLSRLYKQDGARCLLWSQGVALKDFTAYTKATTERIADNARKLVTDEGRPVISFDHVKTRNRTQHKDELAKSIAERDGITEGSSVDRAVETCFSFQVRKRYESGKLELFRRERKCLHHYLYLIDAVGMTEALAIRHIVATGCRDVIAASQRATGPGPQVFDDAHAQRIADLGLYVEQHHHEADLAEIGRSLSPARRAGPAQ